MTCLLRAVSPWPLGWVATLSLCCLWAPADVLTATPRGPGRPGTQACTWLALGNLMRAQGKSFNSDVLYNKYKNGKFSCPIHS